MLDTTLLKSPSFLILAASGFLTLSCFFVPFMFIGRNKTDDVRSCTYTVSGALARQRGVDESQTKYLVMLLGMVNLVARVLCGYAYDEKRKPYRICVLRLVD